MPSLFVRVPTFFSSFPLSTCSIRKKAALFGKRDSFSLFLCKELTSFFPRNRTRKKIFFSQIDSSSCRDMLKETLCCFSKYMLCVCIFLKAYSFFMVMSLTTRKGNMSVLKHTHTHTRKKYHGPSSPSFLISLPLF